MKNSFRLIVMQRAYYLMAATGKEWAVCLKKAWLLYRLNKAMHTQEISFIFEKKNGEIRSAFGTLKCDVINYEFKNETQTNIKVFNYYDLEAAAFRCFKIENFMSLVPAKVEEIKPIFNGEEKEEVKVYKDYVKPTPKILARRRKQLSKI